MNTIAVPPQFKDGHPVYTETMWEDTGFKDIIPYDQWMFLQVIKDDMSDVYDNMCVYVRNVLSKHSPPTIDFTSITNDSIVPASSIFYIDTISVVDDVEETFMTDIPAGVMFETFIPYKCTRGETHFTTAGRIIDMVIAYIIVGD